MSLLDPFSVDRELRAGAACWRRWRQQLRRGVTEPAPFGASTRFGKSLYDVVQDLPPDLPLRRPLARWVYRLAEQRIDAPWLAREAELVRLERHPVREPREGQFTLAEMTHAALAGPHSLHWQRARLHASLPLAAHRALLWERRQEIAARMGLPGPDAIELPAAGIYAAAESWLEVSAEGVAELVEPGWGALVESGLARGASEGWPARLASDTLLDLLEQRDWFRGVTLEPGPLPARYAPTSFVRAFARLGAAWQVGLAPAGQLFAIAEDPYGLRAWTRGALWALVACRTPFLRRRLGLSPHRAEAHERELALAVVQWVRLVATRVLARRAALAGGKVLSEAAQELQVRLLRESERPESLLGMTRLRVDDPQRLAAWFLAADEYERLVEEHDEDWFRSPRAVEQAREEAKLPPATEADEAALERGRAALLRWFTERVA